MVENLSFHDITQRVARLLAEESARAGGLVRLSQQETTMRVGTAREVVSRTLRALLDDGPTPRP